MMIMLAGDTHGDLTALRRLMTRAVAERCELVFVVGDFGYWEHTAEGVVFLDKLNEYAQRNSMPIFFLDGNHDKTSLLVDTYGHTAPDNGGFMVVRDMIRYAPRGHQWAWGGQNFISLGGAYSVDKQWRLTLETGRGKPESLWFPEEEMTGPEWDRVFSNQLGSADIMLAHDKPAWSKPGWNRKDLPLCLPNQLYLQSAVAAFEPKLYVHGHLHYHYTDLIGGAPTDEPNTLVVGLDCNQDAAEEHHGPWELTNTYIVLDLERFDESVRGLKDVWQEEARAAEARRGRARAGTGTLVTRTRRSAA